MPAFHSHSPRNSTNAHALPTHASSHASTFESHTASLANALHIFTLFLIIVQPLAQACCPCCYCTLCHCFPLPAVSYSKQGHEQRQFPVDVSRTTDCTNMRSQAGVCVKQPDVSSSYLCSVCTAAAGSYTSDQVRTV